jgi:hypothetical protein
LCRSCDAEKHLRYDGSDSGGKKCKQSYGGTNGGVWRSLRLVRFCSQAIVLFMCACVRARAFIHLQESGFSRREYVFTFNLFYYKKIFINFVH